MRSDVVGEDWYGRDLSGQDFEGVDLVDIDLTEAHAAGATFTDCRFRGVRFNASRWTDSAFTGCTFSRCTFFDAAFERTRLVGSRFDDCTFDLLKVDGGNWSFVSLRRAFGYGYQGRRALIEEKMREDAIAEALGMRPLRAVAADARDPQRLAARLTARFPAAVQRSLRPDRRLPPP